MTGPGEPLGELVEALGLMWASQLPARPYRVATRRWEYVDETPPRPRRSSAEIEVEEALGHHWVTVLSLAGLVPRDFGDNVGFLPIWVEAHAD